MLQLHPETPFDFIFIDADKKGNLDYFTEAKRLVRKGGVIVCCQSSSSFRYDIIT